jgi:hypothetical protein
MAVLVLTLKIPGLLRAQVAHVGDGLGFVRFSAYHLAAQAIGIGGGAGGAGGRVRGSAPPAAARGHAAAHP